MLVRRVEENIFYGLHGRITSENPELEFIDLLVLKDVISCQKRLRLTRDGHHTLLLFALKSKVSSETIRMSSHAAWKVQFRVGHGDCFWEVGEMAGEERGDI